MSVALDATGTAASGTAVTSLNFTGLTVGASLSNSALVAAIGFSGTTSGVTANWDSAGTPQAMTATTGTPQVVAVWTDTANLFALVNPTAGNKTLAVSWTTATTIRINAQSFSGVDQTGGTTSFAHGAGTNGSNSLATIAITSAVGNYVMACVQVDGGSASAASGTEIMNLGGGGTSAAAEYAAGASSVTMSWTITNTQWGILGVDVVASGGAAVTTAQEIPVFDQALSGQWIGQSWDR